MKKYRILEKLSLKSLQMQMMLITIFVIVIPVAFLFQYNFKTSENILKEKTSQLILSNMEKSANEVERITQEIKKMSSLCEMNAQIMSNLRASAKDPLTIYHGSDLDLLDSEHVIRVSAVETNLTDLKSNFFDALSHVIIIGSDGMIYTSLDRVDNQLSFKKQFIESYFQEDWYHQLISGEKVSLWVAPFTYHFESGTSQEPYVAFIRTLRDKTSNQVLGILIVAFPKENFRNLSLWQDGTISLLNNKDEVIFPARQNSQENISSGILNLVRSTSAKGVYSLTQNKFPYLIYSVAAGEQGFWLMNMIPGKEVMQEIDALKFRVTLMNLLCFFVFFMVSTLLVLHLTKPLKNLILEFKQMKIGRYGMDLDSGSNIDDISGITSSFDYLFRRVEELVDQVLDEQKNKYEFEYEALKAQINPHFLFNTLNSIKWSASMSGAPNVAQMISSLGLLLEAMMDVSDEEIALKEEMKLISAYVYIQNVRYYDKFELDIDLPESLAQARILRFILQPIVENSIIHGFANYVGIGTIRIVCSEKDKRLTIDICDNGAGIEPSRAEMLLDVAGRSESKGRLNGIGVANVNRRIQLKYGIDYGLKIMPGEQKGTNVSIILPLHLT